DKNSTHLCELAKNRQRNSTVASVATFSSAFTLRPIFGTTLFPVGHTLRVKDAANDVIAHAGQVANPAPTHKHDGVLLEIVALSGDVSRYLDAIGKAHSRHLPQG